MKSSICLVMPLILIACGSEVSTAAPPTATQPAQVDSSAANDDAFTMQIVDVFQISGKGTVLTGTVKTGTLSNGDNVCVPLTSGETVARTVAGIEMYREILDKVVAGQSVGVLVERIEKTDVKEMAVLHSSCT